MDLIVQWCLSSIKRHKLVHSYNGNESHEEIRQLVCVVCSKLIPKAANESSKDKAKIFLSNRPKVVKVLIDHFCEEKMPNLANELRVQSNRFPCVVCKKCYPYVNGLKKGKLHTKMNYDFLNELTHQVQIRESRAGCGCVLCTSYLEQHLNFRHTGSERERAKLGKVKRLQPGSFATGHKFSSAPDLDSPRLGRPSVASKKRPRDPCSSKDRKHARLLKLLKQKLNYHANERTRKENRVDLDQLSHENVLLMKSVLNLV
jgi:hypothetical protein